ncbi:MAG: CehA/McbA family metallohydrolase, partial [Promethearchaeota archaeon]
GEPFSRAGAIARELSGPAEFIVAVDPDGKRSAPFSGYVRIGSSPVLEVIPATVDRLLVRAPADAVRGREVPVKLLYIDRFNNPVRVETRRVKTASSLKYIRERFRTRVGSSEYEAVSNPVRLHGDDFSGLKLYWGDIHGHTHHSDGLGSIDDFYQFAIEIASLDFAAITDHDDIGPRLSDEEWVLIKDGADRYYKPGRFVTFIGHEYRNGLCDMNVYYLSRSAPLLRGTDGDLASAKKFTGIVRKNGGMIIPHMHFGADWSGMDPRVYRVMEVYSSHGSAEYKGCPREIPYLRKQVQKTSRTNVNCHVHDVLDLGYRLGLTAGSDTHSGRPGFSDWTRVCRTYLGGLTAVYAKALTREDLWDAIYNRRCYATTGNRSILDFSINGAMMGSEVAVEPETPRRIYVRCLADGILKTLVIFRSGEVIIRENNILSDGIEKIYIDKPGKRSDWYYVRLELVDGGMVWSSPIWIDCLDLM